MKPAELEHRKRGSHRFGTDRRAGRIAYRRTTARSKRCWWRRQSPNPLHIVLPMLGFWGVILWVLTVD